MTEPLSLSLEGASAIRRATETSRRADDAARNARASADAVDRRVQAVESRLDQLVGSIRDRDGATATAPPVPTGSAHTNGLLERVEGLEAEVHRLGVDLRAVGEETRSTTSSHKGTQAAVDSLERQYIRLANQVAHLQQSTAGEEEEAHSGVGRTSPLLRSERLGHSMQPSSPPRLGKTLATLQVRREGDETRRRHHQRKHVASPPAVDASARGPLGTELGRRA